jgi:hypothetical protein
MPLPSAWITCTPPPVYGRPVSAIAPPSGGHTSSSAGASVSSTSSRPLHETYYQTGYARHHPAILGWKSGPALTRVPSRCECANFSRASDIKHRQVVINPG